MTEERKETFEEEINQSERIDADEEPLSRMSRKASRQSKQKQKQKQKPRQERGESTVKDKLASVWATINRYCGFAFSILKSPAKTVVTDGFSHYKYGLISMLIFSIIFSIGNWFQLKASWNRPLGFGERHHAFYDGFLVVLVYLLIFFAVMVFAIWAVSRYMMKQKVTFREACRIGFIACTDNCCFNPLADLCDRKYPNADSTVYGADLVFHLFYHRAVCTACVPGGTRCTN